MPEGGSICPKKQYRRIYKFKYCTGTGPGYSASCARARAVQCRTRRRQKLKCFCLPDLGTVPVVLPVLWGTMNTINSRSTMRIVAVLVELRISVQHISAAVVGNGAPQAATALRWRWRCACCRRTALPAHGGTVGADLSRLPRSQLGLFLLALLRLGAS